MRNQHAEGWCRGESDEPCGVGDTCYRQAGEVGQQTLTSPVQCVTQVGSLRNWEGAILRERREAQRSGVTHNVQMEGCSWVHESVWVCEVGTGCHDGNGQGCLVDEWQGGGGASTSRAWEQDPGRHEVPAPQGQMARWV